MGNRFLRKILNLNISTEKRAFTKIFFWFMRVFVTKICRYVPNKNVWGKAALEKGEA
jgi:hypothetical protein